jgi:hypothetical protein
VSLTDEKPFTSRAEKQSRAGAAAAADEVTGWDEHEARATQAGASAKLRLRRIMALLLGPFDSTPLYPRKMLA